MKRRFTSRERGALFLNADGLCEQCGAPLEPGWHSDHIVPYAAGGATDVINGQALCPQCNLSKGQRAMKGRPREPREWQAKFIAACVEAFRNRKRDFLCVATPGSGKTWAALKVMYELKRLGLIERVAIVTPSDPLTKAWLTESHMVGFDLGSKAKPGEARHYQGNVVTYASLPYNAEFQRAECRKATGLIFDRIHHLEEDERWGEAAKKAFGENTYRLGLSGTPFRTKGAIPFVHYDETEPGRWKAKADYSYSHGDAVRDGVCRRVMFPTIDATRIEWKRGRQRFAASLSECSLSDELIAERNTVILDPRSELVQVYSQRRMKS